jgi:predicted nucleic acid-binding protein
MLTDLPIIYWDACVPLSYINGITDRLPDIEGLLRKSGADFQLITSVYSIIEVAFAAIEQEAKTADPEIEEKISNLWALGSPIQTVEFYGLIAEKARKLMRDALSEGWSLKPGDALHLATADHLKVGAFHTYDEGLDKYEKITGTHFKICRPIATQPVIVMPAAEPQKPKDSSGQTTEGA